MQAIGYADGANLYEMLYNGAVGTIILVVAGSLPGYWTAIVTIDTLGRRNLQVFGFLILTVIFCVLGFAYHRLSQTSLLALYIVANFFFNWGPNTTTFIVPGECFPTRYRSSGHGLSAAMGKIGAIIAQVISTPLLAKGAPRDCSDVSGTSCSPWIDRLMQVSHSLESTFITLPKRKPCNSRSRVPYSLVIASKFPCLTKFHISAG